MAGEFTVNFNRSMVIGGKTIGGLDNQVSVDGIVLLEKTIPSSTTNGEFDQDVTIANVLCMGIHADQDCTVKTNSTGSPDETLALKRNQPLLYNSASDPTGTKFITHDITKFYVTTTVATNFVFGAGLNATPVLVP